MRDAINADRLDGLHVMLREQLAEIAVTVEAIGEYDPWHVHRLPALPMLTDHQRWAMLVDDAWPERYVDARDGDCFACGGTGLRVWHGPRLSDCDRCADT